VWFLENTGVKLPCVTRIDKIKLHNSMALLNSYRNTLSRKQTELGKLLNDKAKEQKKISNANGKINRARETMGRTRSESTIKSKMREVTRYQKDLAKYYKQIADIETKIGRKNKEIQDAQKK